MPKPKISWKRIEGELQSGVGIGFGEGYLPALSIKRWNPSPVSVQVVKSLYPFERQHHFFSLSEWYLALLFAWLGAEVREQFPIWPWRHQHPEYGRKPQFDRTLPWSDGMLSICREAGIDHGVFIGTNIPYIWTIDLVLSLPWIENPANACCLVSVKPLESEKYLYIDPLERGPEKLEAERRYAEKLNLPYFVGDRTLFPGPLFGQLECLAQAAAIPAGDSLCTTLSSFLDRHASTLQADPICEIQKRLEVDFKLDEERAGTLVNHMLWHQVIDCDPSRLINRSLPAKPGGRSLIPALRSNIQGGKK